MPDSNEFETTLSLISKNETRLLRDFLKLSARKGANRAVIEIELLSSIASALRMTKSTQ